MTQSPPTILMNIFTATQSSKYGSTHSSPIKKKENIANNDFSYSKKMRHKNSSRSSLFEYVVDVPVPGHVPVKCS